MQTIFTNDVHDNMASRVCGTPVTGKPIHWARIFWSIKHKNGKEMFEGSMNYMSPFFINFYRGMGLLTEAKKQKFLLKREIAESDDKGVLGDVLSFKGCGLKCRIASQETSSYADEYNENETRMAFGEGPLEWGPLDMPMDGSLAKGEERKDETETETLGQRLRPSTFGTTTSTYGRRSSAFGVFDCGKEHLAEEPKTAEFSLADLMSDRIVSLIKYLDGKMAKYPEPESVGSYVELVRRKTKAKVVATAKVAERVASLTSECATMRVTLVRVQKGVGRKLRSQLAAVEEKLVAAPAKLMKAEVTVQQLEQQMDACKDRAMSSRLRELEVNKIGFARASIEGIGSQRSCKTLTAR
ncbi:hypothetical protein AXG93_3052s1030 [Marchantia polymorpha subsp. ruderalis]|uniref:Uncharacterized protein n=1 Tax=Marchantia polymorpha subsp. ruderalis TaxID=1480154 RepID=A0A176WJP2_MARPO|nr:hypothetical protein AXG93_3052s1030 [Marchantia polymorpha subsp. ruderalis]